MPSDRELFSPVVEDEGAMGLNAAEITSRYSDIPNNMREGGKSELETAQLFYNHAVEEIHRGNNRIVRLCNRTICAGIEELEAAGAISNLESVAKHALEARLKVLKTDHSEFEFLVEYNEVILGLMQTGVLDWGPVLERAQALYEETREHVKGRAETVPLTGSAESED